MDLRAGRASAADASRLRQHLASCADCRQQLSTLAAAGSADTTSPPPPHDAAVGEPIDDTDESGQQAHTGTWSENRAAANNPPTHPWPRITGYEVLGELGHGGMGVVYKARHVKLKRLVALKVMRSALAGNPVARRRFTREATAMAAIEHDHVVAVYQVGEEDGLPYLAMPLLQGETLHGRLQRERTLPYAAVVELGRQIALGLAAAHRVGLVHRDIKPANIWLEGARYEGRGAREGVGGVSSLAPRPSPLAPVRVKILDFGLARAADQESLVSAPGAPAGTPQFMSPEQAQGAEIDARSDLFSLGAVLYRMAGGELPFQAGTATAILLAIVHDAPTPLGQLDPHVPAAFCDLVMRLLAKQPDRRPQSAEEVAEALARLQQPADAAPADEAPQRRAIRWLLPLGLAVVFAAIVVAVVLRWRTPDATVRVDPVQPAVRNESNQAIPQVATPGQRVDELMLGAMAKLGCTAAAVAVERNGRPLYQKAYGFCDRQLTIPATLQTRFPVGNHFNIVFLHASVLRLAQQKRLQLNDSVLKVLRTEPSGAVADPRVWDIRVRDLLERRTGWDDDLVESARRTFPSGNQTLEQVLAVLATKPLREAPGTVARDCAFCWRLLAPVITRVSGKSRGDYFRHDLLGRDVAGIADPNAPELVADAVWNCSMGEFAVSAPATLEVLRSLNLTGVEQHSGHHVDAYTCNLRVRADGVRLVVLFNSGRDPSVFPELEPELVRVVDRMVEDD
jgi:serine/threonine protein kinase